MRRSQSKTGWRAAVAVCAMVCLPPGHASAQGRTWTLADVLARAREQAPQIVSARLAVDEARGQVMGASVRHQSNPDVNLQAGRRNGERGRFIDVQVGVRQTLDTSARRAARIDGANAIVEQSAIGVEETTRAALRVAADAYYRALHAHARMRLTDRAWELASQVQQVANQRFQAGDIAVLDVNLARAAAARRAAERMTTQATYAQAHGDLKQVLGVKDDMTLEGTLGAGDEPDSSALFRTATQRPDLRAIEAGVRQAQADVRLGLASTKSTYGVGVQYSREEGDQVVLGGLTITLPTFLNGQELRATGAARAARLQSDYGAAIARVLIEVQTAVDVYTIRREAVRALESEALPVLDESDTLTTRSFEVGQINLTELLLIQREFLDVRLHYLDALLDVTLARLAVDAAAGVLR